MSEATKSYQTAIVNLANISIGERFREDYGDLTAMQRSIEKHGLINPVTVTVNNSADSQEDYTLVAGGRRISALAEMGQMEIPCRIYSHELNELELRSIELEENLARKSLDWKEQVKLQQEIHSLQVAIHGEKTSTSPDASGYSLTDTAKLLGRDKSSLSKDLKLAEAVRSFPEIDWSSCKNKADAVKMTKKIEEKIITKALTAKAKAKMGSGEAKMRRLADSYVTGNFFDMVKKVPSGSINLFEIDPPYAIDLVTNKKDYNYENYNEVDAQFYVDFLTKLFAECWRTAAPNSWMICWTSFDWADRLFKLAETQGFKGCPIPGAWIKPNGQTNNPNMRLASAFEVFYYFSKGSPVLAKPGSSNTFIFNPVSPVKKVHPTERPMELITDVLKTFGTASARVLIPFAGSGTTLLAAADLDMIPIGYDLSSAYRDAYLVRVAERS